jgi:hypothetical protein
MKILSAIYAKKDPGVKWVKNDSKNKRYRIPILENLGIRQSQDNPSGVSRSVQGSNYSPGIGTNDTI